MQKYARCVILKFKCKICHLEINMQSMPKYALPNFVHCTIICCAGPPFLGWAGLQPITGPAAFLLLLLPSQVNILMLVSRKKKDKVRGDRVSDSVHARQTQGKGWLADVINLLFLLRCLGSGLRYMIRVTLFFTLRESENTQTELHAKSENYPCQ